jgi:hypothetical protein
MGACSIVNRAEKELWAEDKIQVFWQDKAWGRKNCNETDCQ